MVKAQYLGKIQLQHYLILPPYNNSSNINCVNNNNLFRLIA